MVFQSYALYPHMTVRRNLAFPLHAGGPPAPEISARVEEVCGRSSASSPLLDRRPGELSGGERQRVALGRALVRRPKVFLSTSRCRTSTRRCVLGARAELKKLHERLGATFVYVTHDQAEAMTLADRIAVLRDGALEQVATPREINGAPETAFVARFVGTPPVNLVAPRGARAAGRQRGRRALAARDLRVARGDARPAPTRGVWLVEPMGSETWVNGGARRRAPRGALRRRVRRAARRAGAARVRSAAAALVRPADRAARARRGRRLRSILASGAAAGRTARAALCGAPGRPDRADGIHTVYEGPTDPEPTR